MKGYHGLIKTGGVCWVIQNQTAVNAIGLPGPCPYERRSPKYDCPHDFVVGVRGTQKLEADLALIRSDAVGRLFLPTILAEDADRRMIFIQNEDASASEMIARKLSQLWGAPGITRVCRITDANMLHVKIERNKTNLIPMVFTNATILDQEKLFKLSRLDAEQRIVVFGNKGCVVSPDMADRMGPSTLTLPELRDMTLWQVGSLALQKYMRGEQ